MQQEQKDAAVPRVYEVPFYEDTLLVLEDQYGERFVVMKPIVEAFGLSWVGQLQRISRHPVLSEGACVMQVPSDGGDQETTVLPIELFHGWLFTIDTSRVKPDAQDKLVAYQRECFDVLYSYFTEGVAVNPRIPRKDFDLTRKIKAEQSWDMVEVSLSAISKACDLLPVRLRPQFLADTCTLSVKVHTAGTKPSKETITALLNKVLDTGVPLHKDEVAALSRKDTAGPAIALLRADGYPVWKGSDGLYVKSTT